jgi:hypothetical protein
MDALKLNIFQYELAKDTCALAKGCANLRANHLGDLQAQAGFESAQKNGVCEASCDRNGLALFRSHIRITPNGPQTGVGRMTASG